MDQRTGGKWSKQEDDLLSQAVELYGENNWEKISEILTRRTAQNCENRWKFYTLVGLNKGPWTQEEDKTIRDAVMTVRLSLVFVISIDFSLLLNRELLNGVKLHQC